MKKDILNYFRTDRTYKVGIALYMLYGNRVSFKKQLNIQSETKELKETLFEELRAIAGIEQKEFQAILKVPVKQVPAGSISMEEQLDPLEVPGSESTEEIPEEVTEPVIPEEVKDPVIPEEEQPVPEPAPEIPEEVQPVPEEVTEPVIPEEVKPVPEPEPEPKKENNPPVIHQKPKRR